MSKLAKRLRKLADYIDTPDYVTARRLGVPLRQYQFFQRVKEYNICCILDIGANSGEFARWCASTFGNVPIHCFEPLPQCEASLRRVAERYRNIQLHLFALGDQEGEFEMYENDFAPSSSLLPMLDRHRELWPKTRLDHKINIQVKTLDQVFSGQPFSGPVFMKMDVQGFEMHVLHGAESMLKNVAVIMLEVLFENLYEGQSSLQDMMNYLSQRGFRFLEFMDERRLPPLGKLVYADAVFVR